MINARLVQSASDVSYLHRLFLVIKSTSSICNASNAHGTEADAVDILVCDFANGVRHGSAMREGFSDLIICTSLILCWRNTD